ncbi:hypothetical protein CYMTET_33448 [Cymbomonas tetramitiformis]|uniref:Uncharacterized protein n=1 Tax=Cymbomonas tetramitiformis TaxID=36881 RepID=A0AAE0KR66_9CHLO|nr:hypothetical protein CYMTET_33448 [Cymbomonas tetramitiformis]
MGDEGPKRHPKVDADLLQYFREIQGLVTAETDAEQVSMLVEGALTEAQGRELKLAGDPKGSRALQIILQHATGEQLLAFLGAVGGLHFATLLANPFGSRVLETLLSQITQQLSRPQKEFIDNLEQALTDICNVLPKYAYDVLTNKAASFGVRSLLSLLAGRELSPKPGGGGGGKGGKGFGKGGGGKGGKGGLGARMFGRGGPGAPQQLHRPFPSLLKQLITSLAMAVQEYVSELWDDEGAGPVLQAMVAALSGRPEMVKAVLPALLGASGGEDAEEGAWLENIPDEHRMWVMEGQGGSRLMEAAIAVAPAPLLTEIYTRYLRAHLLRLSQHYSGNFVVQAFIAATQEPAQIKMILSELEEHITSLLQEQRGGVVGALVAACARLGIAQKEACKALARGVAATTPAAEGEPSGKKAPPWKNLVPALLILDTGRRGEAPPAHPAEALLGCRHLSTIGCSMLQVVIGFPQECCQQFVDSLASLSGEQTLQVAQDSGGAHVIEALLKSSASDKIKKRVVSSMAGHFGQLALSGSTGARCLETCYKLSDIKLKEAIAAELLPIEKELTMSHTTSLLLQRCGLQELKQQPAEWKMKQTKNTAMRSEFADLFSAAADQDGKPSVDDMPEKGSKRRGESAGWVAWLGGWPGGTYGVGDYNEKWGKTAETWCSLVHGRRALLATPRWSHRRSGSICIPPLPSSGFEVSGILSSLVLQRVAGHSLMQEGDVGQNLVPALLILDTGRRGEAPPAHPAEALLGCRHLSTIGCSMLQVVIGFPQECCQQFVDSLASLSGEQTLQVAQDSGGAHVIEALLKSSASDKIKKRVVSSMAGHFGQLALSGSTGARCLETCYKLSDIKLKEAIAAELLPIEKELTMSHTTSLLLQRCGLQELKQQPAEWKMKQTKNTAMRSEFADLFSAAADQDGKPRDAGEDVTAAEEEEEANGAKAVTKGKRAAHGALGSEGRTADRAAAKEATRELGGAEEATRELGGAEVHAAMRVLGFGGGPSTSASITSAPDQTKGKKRSKEKGKWGADLAMGSDVGHVAAVLAEAEAGDREAEGGGRGTRGGEEIDELFKAARGGRKAMKAKGKKGKTKAAPAEPSDLLPPAAEGAVAASLQNVMGAIQKTKRRKGMPGDADEPAKKKKKKFMS